MHVAHPALVPDTIEFRGFQANLARIAQQHDSLVVVPTGMGKTVIALLTIADAIESGARRILILAPTKPLVEQHGRFFTQVLTEPWNGKVRVLTGNVAPAKRADAYGDGLVIATPQVIQNDLISGHLDGKFDWVIYDECHRAIGEYPYTFIGQKLRSLAPQHRRLGLTASPGHEVSKISEVRNHLGLAHVEIRTPTDPDVRPFVQETNMEWETLPLPPAMERVTKRLEEAFQERVEALRKAGLLIGSGRPNRMRLLELGRKLQAQLQRSTDPDPTWFQGLSWQAQAMKIQHALEQATTQGNQAFARYVEGLKKEAEGPRASKATRSVVDDPRINMAYHIARVDDSETPKMGRVEVLAREQIEANPESKVIVFTHYRSTCETMAKRLADAPGLRPVVFVGQGKRKGQDGLTQKQQGEIVQDFTAGKYNVLVATSVAEEGLDIPETDLVVFYEPIPSEIRSIQRRGRTGRKSEGRVVVLMTKGTQDEAAHWSSRRKEQQMVRELQNLRSTLQNQAGPEQSRLGQSPRSARGPSQATLGGETQAATRPSAPTPRQTKSLGSRPASTSIGANAGAASAAAAAAPSAQAKSEAAAASLFEGPRIVCDSREQPGQVVKHLSQLGAQIETRNLDVADFILSDRIVVERKTGADFVASLIDGRLFDQMAKLKDYPRPILILEGEGLQGHRNIAPEALMGALASVCVDYGIPVLSARDAAETARLLMAIAKREQGRGGRRVAIRPSVSGKDDDDVRRAVLCALPSISDSRAAALLACFGSVSAVFSASVEELAAVEGIGPTIAKGIRRIISEKSAETLSTGP